MKTPIFEAKAPAPSSRVFGRSLKQGALECHQAGQGRAAARESERPAKKQFDRLKADGGPCGPETIKNDTPATVGAGLWD